MIFMAVLDFAAVSACCAAPDFKGRIFFAAGKQPQLTVKLTKGEDALKIAQKLVGNYAVARSSPVRNLAILNGKFRIPTHFLDRIAIANPGPLRYNVDNP